MSQVAHFQTSKLSHVKIVLFYEKTRVSHLAEGVPSLGGGVGLDDLSLPTQIYEPKGKKRFSQISKPHHKQYRFQN